jgi:hypothetical protein
MKQIIIPLLVCIAAIRLNGQSCGFSLETLPPRTGISMFPNKNYPAFHAMLSVHRGFLPPKNIVEKPRPAVFMPRWSAEQLPFFCKIEHDWAKGARIPLKFRLGSVEYVDALEGK